MILALDTDLTGTGDAFDSGTQRVTASIVAKEKPDWRKNREQGGRIANRLSASGSIVPYLRHCSEITLFSAIPPKMFASDCSVVNQLKTIGKHRFFTLISKFSSPHKQFPAPSRIMFDEAA
ncbi:hypothetical protein ACIPSK_21365 [Rhizobium sp. LARHSG275]|uniref:hypothetical protein n=1 Tax=Rhizobium TaxID=379 RepID=UPI00138A5874|nr:hypothetical protein [Rhizobium laguerreae]NDK53325.1 hypothetical protein [Rhizobium laguerreae]